MSVQWAKPHTPIMDTKEMDAQFKPNVLNTVVFLISSTQTASTFMANYIGVCGFAHCTDMYMIPMWIIVCPIREKEMYRLKIDLNGRLALSSGLGSLRVTNKNRDA